MTEYAVWDALLAAKTAKLPPPSIDPNEPATGFYRTRQKGQPYKPCAIWRDENGLRCQIDGQDIHPDKTVDIWPFISKNPISYKEFDDYRKLGRWRDIDETVAQQQNGIDRLGIGGNQPPDEFALMKEEVESASAGIKNYVAISSDEQLTRAQTLRSRLLELGGKAEKTRKALGQPHWDAYKAVNDKWKPLADDAQAGADAIRKTMSAYATLKAQAAAEIINKAREEEAEKAASEGKLPPAPPPAAAPMTRVKGAAGRMATEKPVQVATITDQDAVYMHFRNYPEVVVVLQKMADQAAKTGQIVPGTTVREERVFV